MTSILSDTRRKSWGPGIDLVWPLVVLAGLAFYTSLIPLPPNDFWWHLKIGQVIYTTGAIPKTNMFGWSLGADFPYTYGEWLGEYLFYLLYRWAGLSLIIFARTLLATVAFWLAGYEARRRSGSWRIAALAIAFTGVMSMSNLAVRPQNWSWLPFVAFLILLSMYADKQLQGRWLLLCPLMMAFWVNVHGAFILGVVMLGIFFAGEALRTVLKLPGALSWKAVGWIGVVGFMTVLATIANPQGIGIFGYVQDLMTDQPSQKLVMEWQPPAPHGLANVAFFVSVLVLMVVLVYSRYRPSPTEWLLTIGFLWLAWTGQRYMVWFGIVAMPLLARAVKELVRNNPLPVAPQKNVLNLVIACLVFIPAAMVQPWFVERVPLPATYWQQVLRNTGVGPLLSTKTPVAAAEYLKQHPGGHLFNEMGYGSYLIWAVPDQGVFVDPRVELYPYDQWLDYIRITNGTRYEELLAKYGVDRIMLDIESQAELAQSLAADPIWQKEYEDQYTQVWKKKATD